MKAVRCPVCSGSGQYATGAYEGTALITKRCHGCNGQGWVQVSVEKKRAVYPEWGYWYPNWEEK